MVKRTCLEGSEVIIFHFILSEYFDFVSDNIFVLDDSILEYVRRPTDLACSNSCVLYIPSAMIQHIRPIIA